jgi:hypothetical protein
MRKRHCPASSKTWRACQRLMAIPESDRLLLRWSRPSAKGRIHLRRPPAISSFACN